MGEPRKFSFLKIAEGLGYTPAEALSILKIEIQGTGEVSVRRRVQASDGGDDFVPNIAAFDSWNFRNEDLRFSERIQAETGHIKPHYLRLSQSAIDALLLLKNERRDGRVPSYELEDEKQSMDEQIIIEGLTKLEKRLGRRLRAEDL